MVESSFAFKKVIGFKKEVLPAIHIGRRTGDCQTNQKEKQLKTQYEKELPEPSIDNGVVCYQVGDVGVCADISAYEYDIILV